MSNLPIVCIDPGHGGRDPGAIGPDGTKEKDVTLLISLLLAEELLHSETALPILLRTQDTELELARRAELANETGASVVVSVHCNGEAPAAEGTETYHFPGSMLGELYAENVQLAMVKGLDRRNRGVKTSRFAILRRTTAPAILVEPVFVTNPFEEELLGFDQFRAEIAEAICKGLSEVFGG